MSYLTCVSQFSNMLSLWYLISHSFWDRTAWWFLRIIHSSKGYVCCSNRLEHKPLIFQWNSIEYIISCSLDRSFWYAWKSHSIGVGFKMKNTHNCLLFVQLFILSIKVGYSTLFCLYAKTDALQSHIYAQFII